MEDKEVLWKSEEVMLFAKNCERIQNNKTVRAIQKEYETNKDFNITSITKYLK